MNQTGTQTQTNTPNVVHLPPLRAKEGYSSAITNRSNTITVDGAKIWILEMEDVLFHLDSAVMMPESPEGASSSQGGQATASNPNAAAVSAQQEKITGVKALALVFKQLEFDNTKKVLIAGHADTSGKADYNFELSKKRAQGVYLLLAGGDENKAQWAELCAEQHHIEDYQQIMAFSKKKRGWDCDPKKINNQWNADTEKAVKEFLQCAEAEGMLAETSEKVFNDIKNDGKHRWTKEAWSVVFDIYEDMLAKTLSGSADKKVNRKELSARRGVLQKSFFDESCKFVDCGESFPIDSSQRQSYRSQQNRRVEILFFDAKELDPVALKQCRAKEGHVPSPNSQNVETAYKENCPLWPYRDFFLPLYIDPTDLYAIVYHIRFVYFDRIKGVLAPVPEGLLIRAFKDQTNEISVTTVYKNNIYFVKVHYPDPAVDPAPEKVIFQFEGADSTGKKQWIYTKDKKADPVMKKLTDDEFAALTLEEQSKHYDIPVKWSSLNYSFRYEKKGGGTLLEADIMNGNDSRALGKSIFSKFPVGGASDPKFKPFGDSASSPSKPLFICLDDIVLTDNNFISETKTAAQTNEGALLDNEFKVIEPDSTNKKSYLTSGGVTKYRAGGVSAVIIPFTGKHIAGIICDYKLYVVFKDRNREVGYAGHRAAVYDHKTRGKLVKSFQQFHYRGFAIGKFDSYFLKEVRWENGGATSYLFNFFRWHFQDGNPPAELTNNGYQPEFHLDQDWKEQAITAILKVWNNNEQLAALYFKDKDKALTVNIRYYIQSVDTVTQAMLNNNEIQTIVNVHSEYYKNAAGHKKKNYYRSNMGRREGNLVNVDKDLSGGALTAAHEFGHSSSLDDEYLERWNNCCYRKPGFVDFKPGAPYENDASSMMQSNKTIRNRHYYHFAVWLQRNYTDGQTIPFIVKRKNQPDYTLPANSVDPWDPSNDTTKAENYFNLPFNFANNQINSVSTQQRKGRFNLYLYPLGEDDYSKNVLKPGTLFSALLVVKVNLYFNFWVKAKMREICDVLDEIHQGIVHNFSGQKSIKICGSSWCKETYVQVQPRYCVSNCPMKPDPKDKTKTIAEYNEINEDIKTNAEYTNMLNWVLGKPEAGKHFTINVENGLGWFSDPKWTDNQTISMISGDADLIWKYFSEMLGLPRGAKLSEHNFAVGNFVPNGIAKTL